MLTPPASQAAEHAVSTPHLHHLNSVQEYCGGGELYGLLMAQPKKRLPEAHMRFYAAEVLLALQYLHLLGFVYRCHTRQ